MAKGKKSPALPITKSSPPARAKTRPDGSPLKAGPPPYVITEETRIRVRVLAELGFTQDAIAEAIGITRPTLRKYFQDEFEKSSAALQEKILRNYVQLATSEIKAGKNVIPVAEIRKAGEFLLATRFGYTRTTRNELLTPAGESIKTESPADKYKPEAFIAIFRAAWESIAASGVMGSGQQQEDQDE